MSTKLEPCPCCGSKRVGLFIKLLLGKHHGHCMNCGHDGPIGGTRADAAARWNAAARRPAHHAGEE